MTRRPMRPSDPQRHEESDAWLGELVPRRMTTTETPETEPAEPFGAADDIEPWETET